MESRSETVLKGDEVVEEQFCWILLDIERRGF